MGIIKRNYFKSGDHNGICDISGQKYKFSELRLNWRGLWVSHSQWEPKETQLTIRPRMEKISVNTTQRSQMIDITPKVGRLVAKGTVKEGLCFVYVPHTTAGITINEHADPSVAEDILNKLEEMVPEGRGYSHLEGNADSHIKASLMGSSVSVPVENGKLQLGTWQGIFFCEFDGPRSRQAWVDIR